VFCGRRCRIEQTSARLTIARLDIGSDVSVEIPLDGSERPNRLSIDGALVQLWSSATIKGNQLIVRTRVQRGEMRSQSSLIVTVDKDVMKVERQGRGTAAAAATASRVQTYQRRP
jgi:hypothetical protein